MNDAKEQWFEHLARLSDEEAKCEILRVVMVELNLNRLGIPDRNFIAALLRITDIDHLTRMNVRALKAPSWDEVLQTPSSWDEVMQMS